MKLPRPARALIERLAPPGTPRRALLAKLREALRETRNAAIDLEAAQVPCDDIHSRAQWRALLAAHRLPPWRTDAEVDVAGAAGFVIEALLRHHERFPRALTAGPDGPFARWLYEGGAGELGAQGRRNVRVVFERPPGDVVLRCYDVEPGQRAAHPLALTARGRSAHLRSLLARGRRGTQGLEAMGSPSGLLLEAYQIAWFVLQAAEDESAGVVPTYLRNPDWQGEVPDGLGANFERLREWVLGEYDLRVPSSLAMAHTPPWRVLARAEAVAGINVLGYFSYDSGLRTAALHTIRAAEQVGLAVSARDVPVDVRVINEGGLPRALGLECHPVSLLHLVPGESTQHAYERAGLWRRPGVYRVGLWYWELEEGEQAWRRQADFLDEIWCPSTFIADCVRRVMRVPVMTMRPGIEAPTFEPRTRARLGLPEDKFLFLFMFDMRSFFERKNPLAIVRAYREAFTATDPVGVVIKVSHGAVDPDGLAALRAEALRGGVTLIEDVLPRNDVFALVDACDAYVSLHRSEGYGLTLAEAMALGKPVVATGYSGNVDFMSADTSRLVGYVTTRLTRDIGPYRKGSTWADPNVAEAAQALRWIVAEPALAAAMGARARDAIAREASLAAYGARIRRRLAEIGAAHS